MADKKNEEKELKWIEIDSKIDHLLVTPYDEDTKPISNNQAILLRIMISLFEMHTGILPSRISGSADSTLFAYYFLNSGYFGFEVYEQNELEDEEDSPTVLFWSTKTKMHCESLTIPQAVDGKKLKIEFERYKSVTYENHV